MWFFFLLIFKLDLKEEKGTGEREFSGRVSYRFCRICDVLGVMIFYVNCFN